DDSSATQRPCHSGLRGSRQFDAQCSLNAEFGAGAQALRRVEKLPAGCGSAVEQVRNGGVQDILVRASLGSFGDRSHRRRDPKSLALFDLVPVEVCTMQRDRSILLPEPLRHGQMDPRRVGGAEIVNGKSARM
ncbi:MAG: hypothetical protein ACRDTT_24315, partial [Pseudonocardiaceae bacterium]